MNIYQRIVLILGAIALVVIIWKPQLNVVKETVIPKSYLKDLYDAISEYYNVGDYLKFYEKIKLPEKREYLYSILIYEEIVNKNNSDWKNILKDPTFQEQKYEVKKKVAENYYRKNIVKDPIFESQPQKIKERIKNYFIDTVKKEGHGKLKSYLVKGYDEFERKILSSIDKKPYISKNYVFDIKETNFPVGITGVLLCTLLIFFALKGIGKKEGE